MPPNYMTGYAPTTAPLVGSQAMPLDRFEVDGRTGNATTNKDLPEWLRKLGMKGDAYAGGMLKPQIRYGFWFKDGKINFADGTSFKAKKQKGGTYSYTDASGKSAVYDPTDEQDAYNKAYKRSTSNQSFWDKAKNTIKYENAGVKRLWEGIKDNPLTLLTDPARTPAGTWFHNQLTGDDLKPLTGQLGGHSRDDWYDGEKGYAGTLNQAAEAIAAFYGGQGLAGIGDGGAVSGSATGSDLGIFSNGGAGGMAGVGGGNAGALAQSGAITGGAGVAGFGGGAGGGASGASGASNVLGTGGGMASNWGDWVNLALSAYGAYAQGQGAKDAANASAAGSTAGIAEQRRQFDLSRADQMPWLASGVDALNRLNTPGSFQQSPGYDFVRNETLRDTNNNFAARGGALSGNAQRALQDRAGNLASLEYNNWFNQQSNLAGLGQTSAQSLGALGANSANNVSNLLGQQANARASGIEGQTNALTGGISDFLSWYNRRGG